MKPQLITVERGLAEYRLTQDHPLRIAHAAGQQIECLEGTAWLTAYGEHTDFMLRRGQTFELPNDGLMLIEAAGAGVVRVRLPAETTPPPGWRGLQRKVATVLSSLHL
ncbi:MAG TPA: DUF2917 domain-containing protein [Duganella sp.]|nr:DUF2917 domain-containing protein [Duganella sp.]